MRRGPFHHHHQPARFPPASARPHPIILPSGDSWSLPRSWPTLAVLGRRSPGPCVATGRTATSLNLRRTGNHLARERVVGNEGSKDRSAILNLTLSNAREPPWRTPTRGRATCMRAANGFPLPPPRLRFAVSQRRRGCGSSGNGVCRGSSRATRRVTARAARGLWWRA
jgi:hypothetical protein